MRKSILLLMSSLALISMFQACMTIDAILALKNIEDFNLEISETVKVCPNNPFEVKGIVTTDEKEVYTTDTEKVVTWNDIKFNIPNGKFIVEDGKGMIVPGNYSYSKEEQYIEFTAIHKEVKEKLISRKLKISYNCDYNVFYNAKDNEDAKNVTVQVQVVDILDKKMLQVLINDKHHLIELDSKFHINANGANGANGFPGYNGSSGNSAAPYTPATAGEDGSNGSNGKDGSNGADVRFVFSPESITYKNNFTASVLGGIGGLGGQGGRGGQGGSYSSSSYARNGKNGRNGAPGKNGKQGRIFKTTQNLPAKLW